VFESRFPVGSPLAESRARDQARAIRDELLLTSGELTGMMVGVDAQTDRFSIYGRVAGVATRDAWVYSNGNSSSRVPTSWPGDEF